MRFLIILKNFCKRDKNVTLFYASALPARGRECVYALQIFLFFLVFSVRQKYQTTVLGTG